MAQLIRNDSGGLVIDSSSPDSASEVGIRPITQLPGDKDVQKALEDLALGAGAGGVSSIIAGTNITISPTNGQGDVTINSAGPGTGDVTLVQLAATTIPSGASLVGIQDAGGFFTGTTVEAALQQLGTLTSGEVSLAQLAATTIPSGASLVGIHDAGGLITATNVETAFQEVATNVAEIETDLGEMVTATATAQTTADGAVSVNTTQDATIAEIETDLGEMNTATAAAQTSANTALAAQVPVTLEEKFLSRFKSLSPTGWPMFQFDDMENLLGILVTSDGEWEKTGGARATKDHAHSVKCTGTGNMSKVVFERAGSAAIHGANDGVVGKWLLAGAAYFHDAIDVLDDWRALTLVADFPSNLYISVGVHSDVDATHFSFRVGNGTLHTAVSTVAFTTGHHYLEIWSDTVNIYGSIDFEMPVLVTPIANTPAGNWEQWHGAISGTTTIYLDAICTAAERT